jgi:hypothetical protein
MAKRRGVHPLVSAATLLPLAIGMTGNLPSSKTRVPETSSAIHEKSSAIHERKAGACHPSLSSCPIFGCETEGTPHALVNEIKRQVPAAGTPKTLTWEDFTALQQDADSTVGEDTDLDADDRARLHNLSVSSGRVSEGDLVQLAGFLVGSPHPNTGESVNCNLPGSANNDFHIPFASDADETPYQGIVVEMIPQNRPAAWNIKVLKQVEAGRHMVLVTGQLFYDNMHRVNADEDDSLSGQPPRFSLFEIHPITSFVVCLKTDTSCDPSDHAAWETLQEFGGAKSGP